MSLSKKDKGKAHKLARKWLIQVGLSPDRAGYWPIVECIVLLMDDPSLIDVPKRRLYPMAAKALKNEAIQPRTMEKNINMCVKTISQRCPLTDYQRWFGAIENPLRGGLTNRQFLGAASIAVRELMEEEKARGAF